MRGLKNHWIGVYVTVSVLVFAQVAWWVTVFIRQVDQIALLQLQAPGGAALVETVKNQVFHRKVMFLSESFFFAAISCLGLSILYRALNRERHSREIQRCFIQVVSHESKTPLTALKLRLESILDTVSTQSGSAETSAREIQLALGEVHRLCALLDKTMALHRTEREALQFESLCFAEVVESVTRRLEPWFEAKQTHVELDLNREVVVAGDLGGLQNSVQSLLENAVLYNPAVNKKVHIRLSAAGSRAFLRVLDNGPGVDVGEQEKIFDRFYRGKVSRSVAGTGLGLYLARLIIEAHRGVLRLVQTASTGACFEIELPAQVLA